MMQKQKTINKIISKMGDTTDFIDARGSKDLGLSIGFMIILLSIKS